jgi:hypothetical protein
MPGWAKYLRTSLHPCTELLAEQQWSAQKNTGFAREKFPFEARNPYSNFLTRKKVYIPLCSPLAGCTTR